MRGVHDHHRWIARSSTPASLDELATVARREGVLDSSGLCPPRRSAVWWVVGPDADRVPRRMLRGRDDGDEPEALSPDIDGGKVDPAPLKMQGAEWPW